MIKRLTRQERVQMAETKTIEELREMVKVHKTLRMTDFGLIRSIQEQLRMERDVAPVIDGPGYPCLESELEWPKETECCDCCGAVAPLEHTPNGKLCEGCCDDSEFGL